MRIAILTACASLLLLLPGCAEQSPEAHQRTPSYQSSPPPGPPPWDHYLTAYGGSNDSCYLGTPACGGKVVDGQWYYATGAAAHGCHSKLKLSANGKCVVVEVVDNGPAAFVEQKAAATCGGTGVIIDASPLVSKLLFGSSSAGWSDCFAIQVTPVDSSTPAGPTACLPVTPSCGDGVLGSGELCDTGIAAGKFGACPSSCDDGEPCTSDQLVGSACQTTCKHSNICPPAPVCGNGKVDAGEWCDIAVSPGKPGACPTSCDDGDSCTSDHLVSSACQTTCKHSNTCTEPPAPFCGDGKVDAGEWCDTAISPGKPGACPTSCDDGDPCTRDQLMGSACLALCANPRIPDCGATPPVDPQPSGSPCLQNSDCLTGQCLAAPSGFPGGFCSQPCQSSCQRVAGDVELACVVIASHADLGALCYPICDGSRSGCRGGYSCVQRKTATGSIQAACVPDSMLKPSPGSSEPSDAPAGPSEALTGGCAVTGHAGSDLSPLLLLALGLLRRRSRPSACERLYRALRRPHRSVEGPGNR